MLKINVVGLPESCIERIDCYFNMFKKKEWFDNLVVRRVIKNIDRTEVVKGEYLESPAFGGMSPDRLSTGCKAVILMETLDNPDIYATHCGDNCVEDILEIASRKDVTITLHHYMKFPDSGFEALMLNSGKMVNSMEEFVYEYYKCKTGLPNT